MAYEDEYNEEEEKDEEETEDENSDSESVENLEAAYNANVGNNAQTPVDTPTPTPVPAYTPQPAPAQTQTNTAQETAIQSGKEAGTQQENPYGSNTQATTPTENTAGKYDNLTDGQLEYLMKNIDMLDDADKKIVMDMSEQRKNKTQPTTSDYSGNTYGRTGKEGYGKDSYSYSYSAKQLQNEINKKIIQRNKEAVANGKPEDVMSLIKEDGLMGYKTKEAMDKLGMDTSMYGYVKSDSSSGSAPAASSPSVSGDEGSAALVAPQAQQGQGQAQMTKPTVPTDSATNADMARNEQSALREAIAEAQRQAELQKAVNNVLSGNSNLPENAPPMQVSNGTKYTPTLDDALAAARLTNGAQVPQNLNGENVPSAQEPINYNAMADELFQMDRNDWYQRPETQQNANGQVYGQPRYGGVPERGVNDISRDEQLALYDELEQAYRDSVVDKYGRTVPSQAGDSMSRALENKAEPVPEEEISTGNAPVYGSPRYGGVPERTTWDNVDDIAMRQQLAELQNEWNANAAQGEVYGQPRNGSVPSRYTPTSEAIATDDIQSAGTPNYFEQEQDTDAARAAMESNYGEKVPTGLNTMYLFQYINDMDNLKQQFPNYSDSALMDMMLVNEEMKNGQSSYYKWLVSNL